MNLINKRVNSGLFTLDFVFIILRVKVSPGHFFHYILI